MISLVIFIKHFYKMKAYKNNIEYSSNSFIFFFIQIYTYIYTQVLTLSLCIIIVILRIAIHLEFIADYQKVYYFLLIIFSILLTMI